MDKSSPIWLILTQNVLNFRSQYFVTLNNEQCQVLELKTFFCQSVSQQEKEVSLEKLFTSDSNFDSHYAAQEANSDRYLATLLVLQKNGTEIAQGELMNIHLKVSVMVHL